MIILVGMMGSGKSTVGRQLAMKKKTTFSDTDQLIEDTMNMSIHRMVTEFGTKVFREKESDIIKRLKPSHSGVIATGGGSILLEDNRVHLKSLGAIVIYLKNSPQTLVNRLTGDQEQIENRPLLNTKSIDNTIDRIYKERRMIYEAVADVIIVCDNLSIEEIVNEIISFERKWNYSS